MEKNVSDEKGTLIKFQMTQSWGRGLLTEDRLKVQKDLNRPEHWDLSNKMQFSGEKCKVLPLDRKSYMLWYNIRFF